MKFTINNNLRLLTCPLLLAGAVCCSSGNDGDTPAPGPGPDPSPVTGDVLAYVTSADGNRLFTEEGLDYSKVSMSPYRVTIDPSTTYQTVDGFGPAITGATCYNLLQMSQADRTAILRKCFDPETGAGFSFIRVHIGGSDFSMDEYTCCDREGIEFFAIPAVEKDGIFPVLKEILEINPEIKIMGSPWSCPKWMKGTVADPSKPYDSWTGGRLNPAYYDDYAEYFVQWVTEMEENGFPIYAITMQNEPLNKGNSMSLYMPWEDQLAFVKKLGPAFRKAGIDTKILCYDHNYNYDNVAGQQNYPLNIYADADAAQWVDGSAWHNYGGQRERAGQHPRRRARQDDLLHRGLDRHVELQFRELRDRRLRVDLPGDAEPLRQRGSAVEPDARRQGRSEPSWRLYDLLRGHRDQFVGLQDAQVQQPLLRPGPVRQGHPAGCRAHRRVGLHGVGADLPGLPESRRIESLRGAQQERRRTDRRRV